MKEMLDEGRHEIPKLTSNSELIENMEVLIRMTDTTYDEFVKSTKSNFKEIEPMSQNESERALV